MRRRRTQHRITVVLLVLCGFLLLVDIVRSIQTRTWPTGSGWIAVSILVLAMLQMRSRQPSAALTRRGIAVVCLVSAVALTVQVVAVIVYGLPEAWLELAGAIGTLSVVSTAVSARRSAARYLPGRTRQPRTSTRPPSPGLDLGVPPDERRVLQGRCCQWSRSGS